MKPQNRDTAELYVKHLPHFSLAKKLDNAFSTVTHQPLDTLESLDRSGNKLTDRFSQQENYRKR